MVKVLIHLMFLFLEIGKVEELEEEVVGHICPSSHPNAYYGGSYCCKSNREKHYRPQGSKCDGSVIAHSSLCCQGDVYVECPSGPRKCQNFKQGIILIVGCTSWTP